MHAVVYLMIVMLWPADGSAPSLHTMEAPSADICESAKLDLVDEAMKDPKVRYINVECLTLRRGEGT
jgi:hypothetical protein